MKPRQQESLILSRGDAYWGGDCRDPSGAQGLELTTEK